MGYGIPFVHFYLAQCRVENKHKMVTWNDRNRSQLQWRRGAALASPLVAESGTDLSYAARRRCSADIDYGFVWKPGCCWIMVTWAPNKRSWTDCKNVSWAKVTVLPHFCGRIYIRAHCDTITDGLFTDATNVYIFLFRRFHLWNIHNTLIPQSKMVSCCIIQNHLITYL